MVKSQQRSKAKPNYERLMDELANIVTSLEDESISLDNAVTLFKRGKEIYSILNGEIKNAYTLIKVDEEQEDIK